MDDERLTDITCQIEHETEKAYLLFDGKIRAWVPKSRCQDNEDGTFTMPESVAIEKEFA